jgi:hypothetical protein
MDLKGRNQFNKRNFKHLNVGILNFILRIGYLKLKRFRIFGKWIKGIVANKLIYSEDLQLKN